MEEVHKEQTPDFGVVLYEKSNAKHALDAPTGKVGAKGWAQRIYMIILGVALFGWFLYSVINAANDPKMGIVGAIFEHLAALFVLFVAEFILMLTAFNAWGRFTRAMLKHKSLTRQHGRAGFETRKLQDEFSEVDTNKANENSIRVYRDYVVVVNGGQERVIERSQLQRVCCNVVNHSYQLTFELYEGEQVVANVLLPIADLPMVKKHFDNFEYTSASREKGYFKKKLPTVAFLLVPILIGVGILILRSLLLPDMPFIFGAFFISVGLIMIVAQFSDIAVIGNGIMGILIGLLFTALPIAIAFTIADLAEEVTIVSLLSSFTALHAGLSVFFGFGPMLIIIGIAGLIDCARL